MRRAQGSKARTERTFQSRRTPFALVITSKVNMLWTRRSYYQMMLSREPAPRRSRNRQGQRQPRQMTTLASWCNRICRRLHEQESQSSRSPILTRPSSFSSRCWYYPSWWTCRRASRNTWCTWTLSKCTKGPRWRINVFCSTVSTFG